MMMSKVMMLMALLVAFLVFGRTNAAEEGALLRAAEEQAAAQSTAAAVPHVEAGAAEEYPATFAVPASSVEAPGSPVRSSTPPADAAPGTPPGQPISGTSMMGDQARVYLRGDKATKDFSEGNPKWRTSEDPYGRAMSEEETAQRRAANEGLTMNHIHDKRDGGEHGEFPRVPRLHNDQRWNPSTQPTQIDYEKLQPVTGGSGHDTDFTQENYNALMQQIGELEGIGVAQGDIKRDNIMKRSDGTMVLVRDCDVKGDRACTTHINWAQNDFGHPHIEDGSNEQRTIIDPTWDRWKLSKLFKEENPVVDVSGHLPAEFDPEHPQSAPREGHQ